MKTKLAEQMIKHTPTQEDKPSTDEDEVKKIKATERMTQQPDIQQNKGKLAETNSQMAILNRMDDVYIPPVIHPHPPSPGQSEDKRKLHRIIE